MRYFEEILHNLGKELNLSLHPDQHGVCLLTVNNTLNIQLEWEEVKHHRLLIASFLCDIPPGPFREALLKEGLKMNGVFPRAGTFAFSARAQKCVFFTYVYPHQFQHIPTLIDLFSLFMQQALYWKSTLEKGSIPTMVPPSNLPPPAFFQPKTPTP